MVLACIYRPFCRLVPWLDGIPHRGGPDSYSPARRGHLLDPTFFPGPSSLSGLLYLEVKGVHEGGVPRQDYRYVRTTHQDDVSERIHAEVSELTL